jgi:hypothetical protein
MKAPVSDLAREILNNPESAKNLQRSMRTRGAFDSAISFEHNGKTVTWGCARFAPYKSDRPEAKPE